MSIFSWFKRGEMDEPDRPYRVVMHGSDAYVYRENVRVFYIGYGVAAMTKAQTQADLLNEYAFRARQRREATAAGRN